MTLPSVLSVDITYNTGGDYTRNLGSSGEAILHAMQPVAYNFEYRSSLAIVTVKIADGQYCHVDSMYTARYQGPTRLENMGRDMLYMTGCDMY